MFSLRLLPRWQHVARSRCRSSCSRPTGRAGPWGHGLDLSRYRPTGVGLRLGADLRRLSDVAKPRSSVLAQTAAGLGVFLGFDAAVRWLIDTSEMKTLPSQICSMLSAFGGLSLAQVIAPSSTTMLHQALLPAVAWVGRWLPVFLVPVQVMLPTINFPGGLAEAGGLAILLGAGWFGAVVLGARLVGVLSHQAITAPAAGGRSAVKMGLWLPLGWLLLAALVAPAGVKPEVMEALVVGGGDEEMARSLRGLSLASVGVGSFALAMRQGLPGHLCFLANGAATIAVAAAMAFARNESYSQVVKRDYLVGANGPPGSGDRLLWCLGPALVATGVQMFQYRARIVALSKVLFLSCAVVSLSNIVGTVVMGPLLGISPEVTLAATMRCVTIPMALPTYARLCEESGAENNVALVALCAGLSGFIGFGFSQRLLSSAACHAHLDPVARGIATGAAAHALGAACLVAAEPEAFVWGMLAMAVSGVDLLLRWHLLLGSAPAPRCGRHFCPWPTEGPSTAVDARLTAEESDGETVRWRHVHRAFFRANNSVRVKLGM
ncbi:unnamed protein product [Durusdinium trenchii]|uniref:Plastidal glycolate/glycerate translocator 1, chloroplastic n=1 Tax=Durusdinium trenchii TaxID=1381693 RepID=A0ABP0MV02_9DINO